MEANTLMSRLDAWTESGALRPLDLVLTRFIQEQTPESDPAVLLAVALTSERNGHGHVCLDLAGALAHPHALLTHRSDWLTPPPGPSTELAAQLASLTLDDWIARLAQSGAVEDRLGIATAVSDLDGSDTPDPEHAPLILAGTPERPLLYLRRYWTYEQCIRAGIAARLRQPLALPEDATRDLLDVLFAEENADTPPWQRIACALAARSAFAVITGGPGTGKTTTVVRLLALLQGLALGSGGPALRIRLAAPTGKAAARLNESIANQVGQLPFGQLPGGEAMRKAIPTQASTLHRLLGPLPDSRHFRYRAGQPLPADIVVVDEASMIDVEMMSALLSALRPNARLIVLGDKDQLASVEAGAVLGDLCRRARAAHYSRETRAWLERVTGAQMAEDLIDPNGRPLDQAITMLRHSYRFRAEGGIGALAELVNAGVLDGQPVRDPLAALETLFARQADQPDPRLGSIRRIRLTNEQDAQLDQLVREGYWRGPKHQGYLAVLHEQRPPDAAAPEAFDDWARAVLKAQASFQLLTPLRQGPWGVEGLNRRIQRLLSLGANAPIAGANERQWFEGRPVLITRNDYGLGLMNGDIGLSLRVPARRDEHHASTVLRVAFPAGDGTGAIRWILPSRLQAVETVFAMTVHKSQGSEFTHTALVLPDVSNPVLTRELIYTGITRAKSSFTLLHSRDSVVREALGRRVERVSGLAMALDQN
ncbi:exodeoxyribonuclease V subunit alpha [Allochromatium palmeri]|uniref:RecBCD enzyme subunit RecD n=1 Tax=Allochromatium palmeri TaxID=231048 RepID=A0A6N8EAS2_9GAMM|nr:exodeoxyribonuclease V subunit alpha [Allochromatium palmeri]MTW20560.1 exodeoxyribonuclease V subunit alpha [Allochromatium palmeri]